MICMGNLSFKVEPLAKSFYHTNGVSQKDSWGVWSCTKQADAPTLSLALGRDRSEREEGGIESEFVEFVEMKLLA